MTNVLSVSSEAWPLVKTGGLADVVGALPSALAAHNVKVTTFLPAYAKILTSLDKPKIIHTYSDLFGYPANIIEAKINGNNYLLLDAPVFFNRDGGPYSDSYGRDWDDNWLRFAAFSRVAADIASGIIKGKVFDIIHAHDWQAALSLAYLRYAPYRNTNIKSVMTIHNMAFQGYYSAAIFPRLGFPRSAWSIEGVEYHGGVGYLKAGLEAADIITTVSPSYAAEIRTSEFGMGLEGLIISRGNRVRGIVNGIDNAVWNPSIDADIKANYTASTLSKRTQNKRALEVAFGLEKGDGPIFIVVSRLTWQKGMDVLLETIDHLVGMGGRLALLGSGDTKLEAEFASAAGRHNGRVGIRLGYNEALSHQMFAGGDALLVPSRFEPCGLTQLYGLAYGCLPVVARTGGLADTIIDANVAAIAEDAATGVQFSPVNYYSLSQAITRTISLYDNQKIWKSMQKRAMNSDFSWAKSGKEYADLYLLLKS